MLDFLKMLALILSSMSLGITIANEGWMRANPLRTTRIAILLAILTVIVVVVGALLGRSEHR